ncbi:Uncharacterised protein [Mycobacterium tuberculosis]|nr:Uncharacterised protein [Mycobacterium tuberculosis]
MVTRLHNGLRTHRRPIFLSCLGAFGVMLIANGVGCL